MDYSQGENAIGIRPHSQIAFVDLPSEVKAELAEVLSERKVAEEGSLDFVMVFVKSQAELKKLSSRISQRSFRLRG